MQTFHQCTSLPEIHLPSGIKTIPRLCFAYCKRLSKITKYQNIDNKIIWKHLIVTKWKNSYNLQLSEMVNDILLLDLNELSKQNEGAK